LSLAYSLKEGIDGMRRARWSTFFSVVTVAFASMLLGIFIIATLNLRTLVQQLKSRLELEVFIDDSFDDQKIEELERRIEALQGVASVEFISKEKALLSFADLFGDQMEEYIEMLGSNPLPASFRILLREEFRTSERAQEVVAALQSFPELRPQDVVFRLDFLLAVERYVRMALWIDVIVGVFLCGAAVFLVSNNVRLVIANKRRVIQTMQLVGATNGFIRRPFLFQGLIEGLAGGTAAGLLLYFSVKILQAQLPEYILVDRNVFLVVAALGSLLGLIGSWAAVRRFLRPPLSP
jgi:cell division transport system permease protein